MLYLPSKGHSLAERALTRCRYSFLGPSRAKEVRTGVIGYLAAFVVAIVVVALTLTFPRSYYTAEGYGYLVTLFLTAISFPFSQLKLKRAGQHIVADLTSNGHSVSCPPPLLSRRRLGRWLIAEKLSLEDLRLATT
jgi:hypothetical protein